MRHLKHRHILGRKKEHRTALMANLAAALLRHDRIQTTLAKAKALRPFVEKVITLAKEAQTATPERKLYLRRLAVSRVRDEEAVAVLFREKAAMFANREGGYTRIYKLGTRIGDAAEMAVIQLIAADDEGYAKRGKPRSRGDASAKAPAVAAETVVAEPASEPVAASAEVAAEQKVAPDDAGAEKKD